MAKTYARCNNCSREYRCMVARDLIYCAYCGKEGAPKITNKESGECAGMRSAVDLINERIKNGRKYRKELVRQMDEIERRKDELNKRIKSIDKEEDELLAAMDKLKR